tara:strand:+ start:469 stop:810 length:342 start_codon:yes stop_codon:yes gene_type:complete
MNIFLSRQIVSQNKKIHSTNIINKKFKPFIFSSSSNEHDYNLNKYMTDLKIKLFLSQTKISRKYNNLKIICNKDEDNINQEECNNILKELVNELMNKNIIDKEIEIIKKKIIK